MTTLPMAPALIEPTEMESLRYDHPRARWPGAAASGDRRRTRRPDRALAALPPEAGQRITSLGKTIPASWQARMPSAVLRIGVAPRSVRSHPLTGSLAIPLGLSRPVSVPSDGAGWRLRKRRPFSGLHWTSAANGVAPVVPPAVAALVVDETGRRPDTG